MPIVTLSSDQRAAFMGKTGSGKTTLALHFTRPIRRLLVLDAKGTLNTPEWLLTDDNEADRRRLIKGGYARLRIPAPFDGDWTEILDFAWQIGNVVVYIDEVYGVVQPYSRPPNELVTLYTRGRERGIGVWASSQRPAWIPMFVLSEADWLFVLRLNLDADRKRVAEIGGPQVALPIRNRFGFWAFNPNEMEVPMYSEGLRLNSQKKVSA